MKESDVPMLLDRKSFGSEQKSIQILILMYRQKEGIGQVYLDHSRKPHHRYGLDFFGNLEKEFKNHRPIFYDPQTLDQTFTWLRISMI